MLTIHGVPLSVHTRKAIVTAILKKIDYKFEVVIPVVPGNPPANWSTLSPAGLIPVMQDGEFTLADLDRHLPVPRQEAACAANPS
ncbi:glutathione S-transferase N-terminal domain-containing protein [Bradyrhizobium sp. TZ2]